MLLVVFAKAASAQRVEVTSASFPEAIYGRIPDSLFQAEFDRKFTSYDFVFVNKDYRATVDYEQGKGFRVTVRVFVRGKFLKASGFGYGVFRQQYYHKRNIEEIDSIRVMVKTASGRRYDLKEEDIQTIQVSDSWRLLQYAVPFAEIGAVFDMQYRIRRYYLDELPEFVIQERVPVLQAKAQIRNSQYFVYQALPKNVSFPLYHHVQLVDTSGKIRLFVDPAMGFLKTETFFASGIPPLKEEPMVSGDNRAALHFKWSEFGRPRQVLESSWAFSAADAAKRAGYFDETMPKVPVKRSKQSPMAVFFETKNRFTFNGADGIFPANESKSTIAGRADINLELIRRLRTAGFEAYPALVADGTRERLDKSQPGFLQFSALVAVLIHNKDTLLWDAAAAQAVPGVLEARFGGQTALCIKENGFFWFDTDRFTIDQRRAKYQINLDKNGSLAVKVQMEWKGTSAQVAMKLGKLNTDEQRNTFAGLIWEQRTPSKMAVMDFNVDSTQALVTGRVQFEVKDAVPSFADGVDIFPLLIGVLPKSPFTSDWRQQEIRLDATRDYSFEVELNLPPGFKPAPLPEKSRMEIPGASLVISVLEQKQRLLRYKVTLVLQRWYYAPDEYVQIQAFYRFWEQVSLSRWRMVKEK